MNEDKELAAAVREMSRPWDPADYLEDPDDVVAFLEAALEDGDSGLIAEVLDDVERSRAMALAKSGPPREDLRLLLARAARHR